MTKETGSAIFNCTENVLIYLNFHRKAFKICLFFFIKNWISKWYKIVYVWVCTAPKLLRKPLIKYWVPYKKESKFKNIKIKGKRGTCILYLKNNYNYSKCQQEKAKQNETKNVARLLIFSLAEDQSNDKGRSFL